jgi:hypothetical protein
MAAQFCCDAGTFTLDQCLCGQAPLAMYDPLAQIALRPELRRDTILCYKDTSVEGLLSQIQGAVGADNRTVKTNPFYWTEKCSEPQLTICVGKAGAASTPGGSVTVTLDAKSMSGNGQLSRPRAGHRVYVKELDGQGANITAVNKSVTGAHTVTLTAINNEVLDLTKFNQYTLLIDPLIMHVKCDTNCIQTNGFLYSPPYLRKAYVQKFEKGYCLSEDEIDGYAHEVDFFVIKGIDPLTGNAVENYCMPQLNNQLLSDWTDSRVINTLWGRRDDTAQLGFDGLIPTARSSGMYNRFYDPASGVSLKQILMGMVRTLRRENGCNEYMLWHDLSFAMDWSDAIASLVTATGQNCVFSLFGRGGQGMMNFEWFQFKNFEAFGYKFATYMIDAFDTRRYSNYQEHFALMMPACKFRDTAGKVVPAVTYVNMEGCEPGKQKHIFSYDERQRGCRVWNVFLKDQFALEIHCPSKLGLLEKAAC